MAHLDPGTVRTAVAADPRLRVYARDGRLAVIPARRERRRMLLDAVAQGFEPGERYPEREVSLFLRELHPDYAALRRYLVDEGFLSRADGVYWRSGGTVPAGGGSPGAPE